MTVDPSALQAARLALGQIRMCWPLLADARTTRTPRSSAPLSAARRAAQDELVRAERADREAEQTYRALAASPAPLNLVVVDAEQATQDAITVTYWAIRNDLRQWSSSIARWPSLIIASQLTWLTGMLEHTAAHVVDQAAADLTNAVRQLAAVAGVRLDDDWRPLGRRCPNCGLRSLHRWNASTDRREHTIECTNNGGATEPCRCTGDSCPCARSGARTGSRHLWPA